jgi:hypothetical protein
MSDRCDLKPGDDVTLCKRTAWTETAPRWMFWRKRVPSKGAGPVFGEVYKVADVGIARAAKLDWLDEDLVVIRVEGFSDWFSHINFRKVQRRDIGAWLKTAVGNTDKHDKSARDKVKA